MRRTALLLSSTLFACGGSSSPATAPSVARPSTDRPLKPAVSAPRSDASLLPRRVLFSNPDRERPLLSPDGTRISYLSDAGGIVQVWVSPVDDLSKARPVTADEKRGIHRYEWAFDSRHVLYLQDADGDENWHLYAVDLTTGSQRDLTPYDGVQARIVRSSHRIPEEVLVGLNDRDRRWHDLYRVNVRTGARTLVLKNEGYATFHADDDLVVRLVTRTEKDGSTTVLDAVGNGSSKGRMLPAFTIPHEDALTTSVAGFDKSGRKAFLFDSRSRNTAALVELDLRTKHARRIAEDGSADITALVQHPKSRRVQAALATYDRLRWHVVDASIRRDLDLLAQETGGDVRIVSRTLEDDKWLLSAVNGDAPTRTYLYDRTKSSVRLLFSSIRALASVPLAKTEPVIIESRDGLELVGYLTRPRAAAGPGPMVLMVHGGPWMRDTYNFDPWHQWLANRGYAVLSVNYRGSTGFGKQFVNAGDGEWAGKMHDDLVDAVRWAVARKVAQEDRVAIMGGSYGGYAALVGLTFTPELFACGVDVVGPSNLVTNFESVPPYWQAEIARLTKRVGDHRTPEGRKFLLSRSPLPRVDRIVRPLLIVQGANDPRVKRSESDQIVDAMQQKNLPVTYLLYPDEGHGFVRAENVLSFNAVTEIFLAQFLGGPYEPIGDDFEGSSITVPAGADRIVTLGEALNRAPPSSP